MTDYQRSQDAIARAEEAQRRSDVETARAAYAEAAAIQGAWVATLDPSAQPRTKSIYTASVVALYYKAGEVDKARTLGEEALAQSWLIDHAAMRIREVLDVLPLVQETPTPFSDISEQSTLTASPLRQRPMCAQMFWTTRRS